MAVSQKKEKVKPRNRALALPPRAISILCLSQMKESPFIWKVISIVTMAKWVLVLLGI